MFAEQDDKGKIVNRLVRGYGIVAAELPTGTDDSVAGQYCYYHTDEHGDVGYITDEHGVVKNRYAYDAFGRTVRADEVIRNRYQYNGELYDCGTEQYYLRARFYNPVTARFTQEDVYRGDGLNLYAYCGNNAVGYEDPSGYAQVEKLFDDIGTAPGTSSSKNLGKNINSHVGINGDHSTGSHQAQHLIPQEVFANSPYLQSLGFNVDHHQNGIWDKNKNNTSTSLNDLYRSNNVSESMQKQYISENTHHNGYHKLYSQAVNTEVNKIKSELENMRSTGNYSEKQLKRIGRQKVNELVQGLRIMNQEGVELYKKHSSYAEGTDYTNKTSKYNEMFSEKLSNAKKKINSKCGK